jgi:hypothetical protein
VSTGLEDGHSHRSGVGRGPVGTGCSLDLGFPTSFWVALTWDEFRGVLRSQASRCGEILVAHGLEYERYRVPAPSRYPAAPQPGAPSWPLLCLSFSFLLSVSQSFFLPFSTSIFWFFLSLCLSISGPPGLPALPTESYSFLASVTKAGPGPVLGQGLQDSPRPPGTWSPGQP